MSKRELERIVRLWQTRLGLDAWDIRVDWDKPAREGCDATTWRSTDYDRAILYFDTPTWPTWAEKRGLDFVHRIVVHELLHLLVRDLDELVDSLNGQLHRDVFAVTENRYDHEIEGLVDRLSYRLVALSGTTT